jgi:transcriptional regulator with XRE-family HTH domain
MVKKLKKWMAEHRYTQAQLGRAIGYAQQSVGDVLTGRRFPSFQFRIQLERATGLPADGWKSNYKQRKEAP